MRNILLVMSVLALLIPGCDNTVTVGTASGRVLPNVTGGAGEVLVVMDKFVWEAETGEFLKDVLREEFPALPQSEPLFTVAQISPSSFQKVTRFHRSVLLVTINESAEKSAIRFRKDVWARPQIVVQMEAKSSAEAKALIEENASRIQNFLIQYDRQRIADSYKQSMDPELRKMFTENHAVTLTIPRGYNLDVSSDDYSCISVEANDYSQVIHVYEYPVSGVEELSSENLLKKRNAFMKKYVKGPREGSYMTTATVLPPLFYDVELHGKNIVEMRGLWELEGGFMGGPFVSHSVYDAKRQRIVTVEGYIFYPNQKKRVKVRQIEAVLYSMNVL